MSEIKKSPWLSGIIDTLCGAEILRESAIPHKNRLAVILIDSAFETACRAYLRHVARITLSNAHEHRETLVKTIKSKLQHIDPEVWNTIEFYYSDIRCDFYHQSAGKTITDVSLLDYRDTVCFVIDEAFKVKTDALLLSQLGTLKNKQSEVPQETVELSAAKDRIDKIIIAVGAVRPKSVDSVNEYFKQHGDVLRLRKKLFRQVLANNSGSKRYFYFDKTTKEWTLSNMGRTRLSELSGKVVNEHV